MTADRPAAACTKCGGPTAWVSLYTGPRCDSHKPEFDPLVAVAILMAGWPGLAAAYVRLWDGDPYKREAGGWRAAA